MSTHHQDDETRVWHKATWRSLFWVLVLSCVVRCAVILAMYGNLEADPDAYRKLADNFGQTGVYGWKTEHVETGALGDAIRPTAFRPPLYPLVLLSIGGSHATWPIALLHAILGVATVGLVACLGWRAGLRRWAVGAATLVAIDPILLQQSTLVMTETLATFLAALALFCLSKEWSVRCTRWSEIWPLAAAGIVLGFCALCRPTFLPWIGLIALARTLGCPSIGSRDTEPNRLGPEIETADRSFLRRLSGVVVLVGTAILVIMPWAIRNQVVFGKAKLTTTHGGYTVLLGNNPLFYDFVKAGEAGTWDGEQLARAWQRRSLTSGADDAQWDDLARLAARPEPLPASDAATSEFRDDELAYQLARRYIRDQPEMFAYASGLRITRLWRMAPHRVAETESPSRLAARYLVGVWYAIVLGLAIFGMASNRRRICQSPWLYGGLLCFTFTAVHAIYWSDMRMRAPLMPVVCLAAASGMAAVAERFGRRNV